jgi:tetratricopeptide (TPR) repeat protein
MSNSSSSSSQSSSSSPGSQVQQEDTGPVPRPRAAQIEKGGSAVTLEISEPLFDLAAALNACGYDADLDKSLPVRAEVRADMNAALAGSEVARASRDKLCDYIARHSLNDLGLQIAQYVSLALYLSPPPELTPNVDETQLPPQASAVVNVLPLLRDFAEQIDLHYIWLKRRSEYEALTARVHDPMTQMILNTNIYLHQPVSSYDGRRFLVLLEPMFSPNLTNARVYGSDYIIVTSPDNTAGDPVRMDEIRHIYLHYVVEPMVYSRGSAMERIQPMLRGVQDAPLEFSYKSDVVALITECLIKAIEARTYMIPEPKPKKPSGAKARETLDQYQALMAIYDRETALARQKLVTSDEQQGWTMTGYFYQTLGVMEHNGDGLRDEIAPMIYGMDVDRERKHAEEIIFVKNVPADPLRAVVAPRKLEGVDLAEADLLKGDANDAADLADKAMTDPNADHGRATYVLARVDLMHGDPEKAQQEFAKALTLSRDPRTMAWCHIYLGRLYDIESTPERDKAVAEYKAALEVRDGRPDTRIAAESGVAKPYALPQRAKRQTDPDDDKDFDPTGKAEKQAYKPNAPNE